MSAEFKSTTPEAEPTSAVTPMPVWLIMGTLLLLVWGAMMVDQQGGLMSPKVFAPHTSIAELERFQPSKSDEPWRAPGKALFEQNCALCHNIDGSGKPGQAPPLAKSEWVLTKGVNRLIRIPQVGINGPIKAAGQDFNLNMGGMGAGYTDEQLANVLSYIRNSFGNTADPITADHVKKVRAELGGRAQPYTAEELMKLPE